MTDEVAIRATNVGKKYSIGLEREPSGTFRDEIARQMRNVTSALKKDCRPKGKHEEFWALRNVNFEIVRGEVIGVVGRNGAGKSTLLKILSRITEPTEGEVELRGRVASLLEVGTGFHPELTGRENIFLNGAVLGMTRTEVKRKFDEIVDFAGVERFLDTPVKRYSSGMYVRLAFAVSAHLEPEILIVDEVLAVGDYEFQQKCLGRMQEVSASGRTILFVSHNIGALLATCSSGLLLDGGQVVARGTMEKVAQEYRNSTTKAGSLNARAFTGGLKSVEFIDIRASGTVLEGYVACKPGDPLRLTISGICKSPIDDYQLHFSLFRDDVRIFTIHHSSVRLAEGPFYNWVEIPALLLRPGIYSASFGAGRSKDGSWSWGADLLRIEIAEEWSEAYCMQDLGLINLSGVNCGIDPQ